MPKNFIRTQKKSEQQKKTDPGQPDYYEQTARQERKNEYPNGFLFVYPEKPEAETEKPEAPAVTTEPNQPEGHEQFEREMEILRQHDGTFFQELGNLHRAWESSKLEDEQITELCTRFVRSCLADPEIEITTADALKALEDYCGYSAEDARRKLREMGHSFSR